MAKSKPHPTFGDNINIYLSMEVGSHCPKCGIKLVYKKSKTLQKQYEIAHIYPLNPTAEELEILKDVDKRSEDPNDPKNLIILCKNCHKQFDFPRTVDDYRDMIKLKALLEKNAYERSSWPEYSLKSEIKRIIEALLDDKASTNYLPLEYEPKTIEDKLKSDVSGVIKNEIRRNVQDYYAISNAYLKDLECEIPGVTDLILSQIRSYYSKLAFEKHSKAEIIDFISDWICSKSGVPHGTPARILTAYFIQHCEVF